ncbi:F-box/WD repeat-containing protein 7-like isoform X2 [Zophobas morio]|uniref:F-box/WD repeat-containing protein 7-like isoform X2 n=1 Tax=Zophobas morio TaxID=2755281 RepID=UPI003082B8F1
MLENSVNEPDRAPGETKFEMSSIPHLRKAYLKRIRKKCRRLYKKPCYEQRVWLKDFDNLDVRDKISFIHELLFRCDSESLKVINTTLSNLRKVDFISELPKDLALFLISKLEVKSLIYSSQVNHLWAALTNCEWVWKSAYEKLISENGGGLPIQTKLTNNSWKTLCVQEYAIITNWYSKRFLTRELLGHREEIITYIKLDGNRIISGSVDFTIKIWSTETGELIHNLEGHTGGVWSCYVEGNLVISGGTDQTIRIWDAQEGRCLHVLYGHTSTVRCLDASGDMLVSGGRDHTVRVWNILSGECLLLLRGHTQSVRCVQFDGKIVVSGSYDHTLRVWDPVSGRCLHVLTGHTNRNERIDDCIGVAGYYNPSLVRGDGEVLKRAFRAFFSGGAVATQRKSSALRECRQVAAPLGRQNRPNPACPQWP